MKTRVQVLLRGLAAAVLTGALIALLPVGPASGRRSHSCGGAAVPTVTTIPVARAATLCLINRARASLGLRPLRRNRRLVRAAQGHSSWQVASVTRESALHRRRH